MQISLTDAGAELKGRCGCVPTAMFESLNLPIEKGVALKGLLDELIGRLSSVPGSGDASAD